MGTDFSFHTEGGAKGLSGSSKWIGAPICAILATVLGITAISAGDSTSAASLERIATCRDDQQRMFMTPDAAARQGVACQKLEDEHRIKYETTP